MNFTREQYDLWFNTWIRPELIDLIPELRAIKTELRKGDCED